MIAQSILILENINVFSSIQLFDNPRVLQSHGGNEPTDHQRRGDKKVIILWM